MHTHHQGPTHPFIPNTCLLLLSCPVPSPNPLGQLSKVLQWPTTAESRPFITLGYLCTSTCIPNPKRHLAASSLHWLQSKSYVFCYFTPADIDVLPLKKTLHCNFWRSWEKPCKSVVVNPTQRSRIALRAKSNDLASDFLAKTACVKIPQGTDWDQDVIRPMLDLNKNTFSCISLDFKHSFRQRVCIKIPMFLSKYPPRP